MNVETTHEPGERLAVLLESGAPGHRGAACRPRTARRSRTRSSASRVETLAGRLATAGVRRGDRVALVAPERPRVRPAAARDHRARRRGRAAQPGVHRGRVRLLPRRHRAARAAAPGRRVRRRPRRGAAERHGRRRRRRARASLPEPLVGGQRSTQESRFEPGEPDDIALVLHTSGTTSRPKQVPLLQRNLMASARTIAAHYRLGPDDVSFCVMPLFHVHGLVASTFAALAGGGTVVVPRRFSPHRFWPQAREHGVTWLSAGPTLHQMILDRRPTTAARRATLRFVRSCSSALSPALLAAGRGRPTACRCSRRTA